MADNPRNGELLLPYLNGEDLNSRPDQSPSRWVINFRDWPLSRGAAAGWRIGDEAQREKWVRSGVVPADYPDPVAADYPDCLAILQQRAKPERERSNRKVYRDRWWQFAERQPALKMAMKHLRRVLVIPETTKFCAFTFRPTSIVFSHTIKIMVMERSAYFTLLSSSIHEAWARAYSSTLESRLKYITSDAFETFPFPNVVEGMDAIGDQYSSMRIAVMAARVEGLTKTYNRFHDSREIAPDIERLREAHVTMDRAVAVAYGWTDVDLGHGFHETRQGPRFTINEAARREVLARLLTLNHERYADEVNRGLHESNRRPTRRGAETESDTQLDLPDPGGG